MVRSDGRQGERIGVGTPDSTRPDGGTPGDALLLAGGYCDSEPATVPPTASYSLPAALVRQAGRRVESSWASANHGGPRLIVDVWVELMRVDLLLNHATRRPQIDRANRVAPKSGYHQTNNNQSRASAHSRNFLVEMSSRWEKTYRVGRGL